MGDRLTKMLSTFFYIGYFPAAPGTVASAAGALIACVLMDNVFLYIVATVIITVIGFLVSGDMEKMIKSKDPSCIVIDEVAGIMISFFLLPWNTPVILTTFFLFRAFDMFKIYPVNKFEAIEGGTGVMMDDLFAGLYTNVTMHIALWLVSIV
ncbi:MAG: phosphatidylglycerophosphatase A [Candidatus Omnitrophica bacterium]|nr:phosphatidylglycerophosphatase A [Candidatus Omnitrophota bacterium]